MRPIGQTARLSSTPAPIPIPPPGNPRIGPRNLSAFPHAAFNSEPKPTRADTGGAALPGCNRAPSQHAVTHTRVPGGATSAGNTNAISSFVVFPAIVNLSSVCG